MTDFIIEKPPSNLSSHAGLAFVGKYLKRININALSCEACSTPETIKSCITMRGVRREP
jgi:hypothetical protein